MLRTEVGAIFFDDDMSDVIDMAINAKGVKEAYEKLNGHRQRFFKNGGLTGGLPKLLRRKALQLLGFRRRRISSSPPYTMNSCNNLGVIVKSLYPEKENWS